MSEQWGSLNKMSTLILAGQIFDVPSPPFGKLRKIIGSFNRMRNPRNDLGQFVESGSDEASEYSMNQMSIIFGLLIGKTTDEIDCMNITFKEMTDALSAVPEICGLVERKPESGEAQAVTVGMESTAT